MLSLQEAPPEEALEPEHVAQQAPRMPLEPQRPLYLGRARGGGGGGRLCGAV